METGFLIGAILLFIVAGAIAFWKTKNKAVLVATVLCSLTLATFGASNTSILIFGIGYMAAGAYLAFLKKSSAA